VHLFHTQPKMNTEWGSCAHSSTGFISTASERSLL